MGCNKISLYCMFIMKYEDFAKYCEWLFAVLAEVEPYIPIQNYKPYQKRVFAFMAERLLNVYILKNKMKPEYLNVYFYGFYGDEGKQGGLLGKLPGFLQDSLSFLRHVFGCLKLEIVFRLGRLGNSW